MREIKFRFIWQHEDTGRILSKIFTIDELSGGAFIKHHAKIGHRWGKTIAKQQYTGLKDKNGVEIYEGDIAIVERYYLTVSYSEEHAGFIFNHPHDLTYISDVSCDVVGNIHENPELLEI